MLIEGIWIEHRLSWRVVAMVVAATLVCLAADMAWRVWRGSTRRLATLVVPLAVAWLAGVWTLAGRLPA